jgi:S1-C subfamily serine protease
MTAGRTGTVVAALVLATVGCSDAPPSDAQLALRASVRVEAEGCTTHSVLGGGAFVAKGMVLTVAHVVAGSTDVDVIFADGTEKRALVVAIDRKKDLAVLAVPSATSPLPRATMHVGSSGEFVAWRTEQATALPFQAMAFVDINASDIDNEATGLRRGYAITAAVQRGDSGSILVSNGAAVAVIFARSTGSAQRAWATDITEAADLLDHAGTTPADVGPCPTG